MFSCSVLGIEGVFRMVLVPSEAETAGSAGIVAEETNEVLLMPW